MKLLVLISVLAFSSTAVAGDATMVLPPGTVVTVPDEEPIVLPEVRFAITRESMEKAIVALEGRKESRLRLDECLSASATADTGFSAAKYVWIGGALALVGAFFLGAKTL